MDNEMIQNRNQEIQEPEAQIPTAQSPAADETRRSKLTLLIKDVFGRIYANKKAFFLVAGSVGLIFLTLLAGIVYKSLNQTGKPSKTMPVPTLQNEQSKNVSIQEQTSLQKIESGLEEIKTEIENLDIRQSLLKPPAINYKINF